MGYSDTNDMKKDNSVIEMALRNKSDKELLDIVLSALVANNSVLLKRLSSSTSPSTYSKEDMKPLDQNAALIFGVVDIRPVLTESVESESDG